MHVCREVNLASSSSWMYIAYISLLVDLISPLYWFLFRTKRERTLFCVYFNPFFDDWQKGGERFWKFIQKREEGFWGEEFLVYACFSHLVYAYIFVYFYALHWISICLLLWVIIKIYVKNVLMYIAYMQGKLNISFIYRFMLSVSYIEEVDISSLCDTCV